MLASFRSLFIVRLLRLFIATLPASTLRLAVLASLLVFPPARSDAQQRVDREQEKAQREHPEIRELRITGTSFASKPELRASLTAKASACRSLLLKPFCWITKSRFVYEKSYLDRDEFQRDVLRALVFYFRR